MLSLWLCLSGGRPTRKHHIVQGVQMGAMVRVYLCGRSDPFDPSGDNEVPRTTGGGTGIRLRLRLGDSMVLVIHRVSNFPCPWYNAIVEVMPHFFYLLYTLDANRYIKRPE